MDTDGKRRADLSLTDRVAIVWVGLVLFGAHLALGGGNNLTALSLTGVYGLTLTGVAGLGWWRMGQEWPRPLVLPAVLFGLTLLVGLLSLTPLSLDRPHTVWRLIGAPATPSIDHSRTIIELIKLLGVASIFGVGASLGRSRRRTAFLFQVLMMLSGLYGLWAFLSFLMAPDTIMGFGDKALFSERLTASFLSPNTAGTFFGMTLVIAVGLLIQSLMRSNAALDGRPAIGSTLSAAALPGTIILIITTALMLTASRSAILSTAAVLALLVFAEAMLRRWSARVFFTVLLPVGAAASLGTLLLSGALFLARIGTVSNETLSRTMIYDPHWREIKAFPAQGFGLGTFEEVHRALLTPERIGPVWNVRAMHNVYLQWLEGAGWLGSAPMFLCCFSILTRIARAASGKNRRASVSRIVLGVSGVVLLHGLTDFALENPSIAGFWAFLLGVGTGSLATLPTHPKVMLPSPLATKRLVQVLKPLHNDLHRVSSDTTAYPGNLAKIRVLSDGRSTLRYPKRPRRVRKLER